MTWFGTFLPIACLPLNGRIQQKQIATSCRMPAIGYARFGLNYFTLAKGCVRQYHWETFRSAVVKFLIQIGPAEKYSI